MPRARASLEVLDARGRVVRTWAGPWEVVRKDWRNLLLKSTLWKTAATVTFSWNDTGNVSRTVRCVGVGSGSGGVPWNNSLADSSTIIKFDIGSGSTAPANSDVAIETQLGSTFNCTSTTFNDGAYTVELRGSLQNTSGGTWTVREVLQRYAMDDTSDTPREFSVDHSSVSPALTVDNNQTVNVKYTWTT